MRHLRFALAAVLVVGLTGSALSGSIFVTGHDAIWHSHFGGNAVGAKNLATTGIAYARDGSALPFLFVESKTVAVPAGNAKTEPFLTSALGYAAADYVHMDAADLAGVGDFATFLAGYSAIVVTSDHGGMLSGAELAFLNANASTIIDYVNAGGGVYAEAESNATGMIGATPRFGFLPFVVSSTDFGAAETGNTVTAFGASLGLVDSDVNGNFSHNLFTATGGMIPVDLFNGDPTKYLSLAFRGRITEEGAVPEPASGAMLLIGAGVVGWVVRRRRRSA